MFFCVEPAMICADGPAAGAGRAPIGRPGSRPRRWASRCPTPRPQEPEHCREPTNLYERIPASLHAAALADAPWPVAGGLTDEACGVKGNVAAYGEGCTGQAVERVHVRLCFRGQRRADWQREHPQRRRCGAGMHHGLDVRPHGPGGSRIGVNGARGLSTDSALQGEASIDDRPMYPPTPPTRALLRLGARTLEGCGIDAGGRPCTGSLSACTGGFPARAGIGLSFSDPPDLRPGFPRTSGDSPFRGRSHAGFAPAFPRAGANSTRSRPLGLVAPRVSAHERGPDRPTAPAFENGPGDREDSAGIGS